MRKIKAIFMVAMMCMVRVVDQIRIIMCTYIKRDGDSENVKIESYYRHLKSKQVLNLRGLVIDFKNTYINVVEYLFLNINCIGADISSVIEKTECSVLYEFK